MNFTDIYQQYYYTTYNYLKSHKWPLIDNLIFDEIINYSFFVAAKKLDIKNNYCQSYLNNIAFNVMRNAYSYKFRYYDRNITLKEIHYNKKIHKDILKIVIESEKQNVLIKALQKLNNLEYKVLVLHYYFDYNFKEISKFLNIKYNSIRLIINKSLKKLKIILEKSHYNYDYFCID